MTTPCENCEKVNECKNKIFKNQVAYTIIFVLTQDCSICSEYCNMKDLSVDNWWNKERRTVYNFFTGYKIGD